MPGIVKGAHLDEKSNFIKNKLSIQ